MTRDQLVKIDQTEMLRTWTRMVLNPDNKFSLEGIDVAKNYHHLICEIDTL